MYYYMFSEGCYSDYNVGGMYCSEKEYTYEEFKNIYKGYIEDQLPDIADQLIVKSLNSMGCSYTIAGIIIGKNPYNHRTQSELFSEHNSKYYDLAREISKKIIPPEEYFVSKGLITELEYTEIWGDE